MLVRKKLTIEAKQFNSVEKPEYRNAFLDWATYNGIYARYLPGQPNTRLKGEIVRKEVPECVLVGTDDGYKPIQPLQILVKEGTSVRIYTSREFFELFEEETTDD